MEMLEIVTDARTFDVVALCTGKCTYFFSGCTLIEKKKYTAAEN